MLQLDRVVHLLTRWPAAMAGREVVDHVFVDLSMPNVVGPGPGAGLDGPYPDPAVEGVVDAFLVGLHLGPVVVVRDGERAPLRVPVDDPGPDRGRAEVLLVRAPGLRRVPGAVVREAAFLVAFLGGRRRLFRDS